MTCYVVAVKPKQTLVKSKRLNWQKIDKLSYAYKVRDGLIKLQQNCNVNSADKNGIETLIAETVTVLNTAVESCTTRKKPSKCSKAESMGLS